MRAYLALLLVLPMTALAQTTVTATAGNVVIDEGNDDDNYINQSECKNPSSDKLSYNWILAKDGTALTLATGATVDVTLTVATVNTCPSPAKPYWQTTINDLSSASGSFPTSGFDDSLGSVLTTLGLNSCSGASIQTLYVCAAGSVSGYIATGTINFDQTVPPPPVITTMDAGESSLTVNVTVGVKTASFVADTDRYYAVATRSDKTGVPVTTEDFTGSSKQITGLTDGVVYDVQVFAKSARGNVSSGSTSKSGSPVPVNDYWKLYRSEGGREEGGCASGPAGVIGLLVPVFFALRRRRS
jgi:hypothetical protein